jgi:drug/metabolite transporter (DMT)-like permease
VNVSALKSPLIRLLIGSVFISFSPVFIKIADVDPDLAGFYRMVFAAAGLLPMFLLQSKRVLPDKRTLLMLICCGIWLGVDFMFWHRSINLIGPGLSTLLGNFQIFFTALFCWLFWRQKISRKFFLAVIAAIIGLCMVTGIDFSSLASTVKIGLLLGLLTAVAYSGYILQMKHAMTNNQISSMTVMLIVSVSCGSFLGLFELANGESLVLTDPKSLLALAAVGLICTSLGWSLISSGIKEVPATLAGLIMLMQPTLAFVWDVLFFDRPTSGIEYLGITMILGAIYLGSASPKKTAEIQVDDAAATATEGQ